MGGHLARATGSRKKTAKRGQPQSAIIDASATMEQLWAEFRKKLEEILDARTAGPYEAMQPADVIDQYLRPYVDRMQDLLLDEDEALVGGQDSRGG